MANQVLNPALVPYDGLFHIFCRARGLEAVSRMGYAVSEDGVRWNHLAAHRVAQTCRNH